MRTYVALGTPSATFLLPNGQSLSVNIIVSNRDKVSAITGSVEGFKPSDIHWLAREVRSHLLRDWFGKGRDEEGVSLDELKDRILAGPQSETIVPDSLVLIDFMKSLAIKYGSKFYAKICSFDGGEPEGEIGNNRVFQNDRLGECVLLGVRLGIDITILEQWRSKLNEENTRYISENIFPKNR